MAKFVREELANEEHEAEAERKLPRWRVLERCAVREAVSMDSATRVELSPDDVVIELGQEIVGEGLHIRCDRGWLSAEHLEKVEGAGGEGAAVDERAQRVQEAMDKLRLQEREQQALCQAQQLCAWGQGTNTRLGAGAPHGAVLQRCPSLLAAIAAHVPLASAEVVRRAQAEESVGVDEQKALVRHNSRVQKALDKQIARAKKKFQQMDIDGNGVLDKEELLNLADWVFESFTPGGRRLSQDEKDMEVARIMATADTDGDGLLEFDEFEGWFRETAARIYEQQRAAAARDRAIERKRAAKAAEEARIAAEKEREGKKEKRFKELVYMVRQEIVVSLGLKSKKNRQMQSAIDRINTIEQLGDFCLTHVKYLPNFDISLLNEVRDMKHFLAEIQILQHLDEAQLEQLSQQLVTRDYSDGDFAMRKGEEGGDEMYIIEDGTCEVLNPQLADDGQVVVQLGRGKYFGEVALLRGAPRNASVRVKGNTRLLALTRATFDAFIGPTLRIVFILAQVPLLAPLSHEDRLNLAKSVAPKTFIDADIVRERDPGDCMYIISAGEAVVSVKGSGEVARKGQGDWFGEQALMTDGARSATVTAVGRVECLELSREAFDKYVFLAMENPHAQAELLLAQVPLLRGVERESRSKLAAEMSTSKFAEGDQIMVQGEPGDCMYILETGSVSVTVDGVGEVAQFEAGQAFGEQALMNNAPRAATITALSSCRCLKLSREQFDEVVMKVLAPVAKIKLVLVQVPLLSKLDQGKLSRLAQATTTRKYAAGDHIITEGDPGECMYIVEQGECSVNVDGIGEVAKKSKGEFFGETALLDDAPRNATIAAVSATVTCLELSRRTFEQFVSSTARVELLLSQIPLLSGLDEEARIALAHKLTLRQYRHGANIVTEGEIGDSMFIVDEGECVVSIKDKGEVARFGRGKYFGEQSLLSDAPRNATIQAAGDCKCFQLGREDFNESVMDIMSGPAQVSLLLAQVPLLSKLDLNQRMRLASLMVEKVYVDGEPIIRIGEAGDCMYIISEGAAVVSTQAGQQLAQLRRGDFFGELALLNDKPRAANVTAAAMSGSAKTNLVVATKCLQLSREDFERLVAGELDRPISRIELLLAQVPLLADLKVDRRQALAQVMRSKLFRAGESIMRQGDDGDKMYIVESGECDVIVEGVGTVAQKGRGDWFGEMALLHGSKRTATVAAKDDCKCLELGRSDFDELVLDVMGPLSRIEMWLAQVPLLNNLEPGKRLELAEQMRRRVLEDGDEVMHQGDSGESMFVVEEGEVSVVIEDEEGRREVAVLCRGQYFGEQALINHAPRMASVLAKGTGCVCLELTRGRFEKSITEHIERLLTRVPLLTSLDPSKRSWLAKGMVLQSFVPGKVIIQEGDVGEMFYIIEQGECVVTIDSVGEVARIGRGAFFGEMALLRDNPRSATVYAATDVRVLELGRADFDRLIGPLAVQGELDVRNVLNLPFDELMKAALQFVYLKRWDAATDAFKKCHNLAPEDPTIVYNLAAIAATQTDVEATLNWLGKAVDIGLTYDDVRDDIDIDDMFSSIAQDVRC